ncbi:hypothetical protein SDC9_204848 [bioreactor metagenome]|uniref:Uncharacterized protein n=1 Tax=bioreactor metagenome TaxID=1076179 RepID=A0A645J9J7_9ZZZZ
MCGNISIYNSSTPFNDILEYVNQEEYYIILADSMDETRYLLDVLRPANYIIIVKNMEH